MTFRLAPLAFASILAAALPAVAHAAQAPAAPAQPAARAAALELAEALGRDFVYPDVGVKYAAMLRANAASGAYDTLSGQALADRMTADLQVVQADGHVRVRAVGAAPAAGGATGAAPVQVPNLEAGRWLAPGVAFVRFNQMASEPADAEATRAFALAHLGAKVLIVDLRTNNGGGLAEMDALFPFLFDRPTPLVRMAARKSVADRDNAPVANQPSLRLVVGDPAFVTREHWVTPAAETGLRAAKVYVLTSGRTASAAEHFALAMKTSRRATLVGESTAGANHFGYGIDLPGKLEAFVPVGRTFDPATGKDWEGDGITPDVAVPAKDALITVLEREGIGAAEAQRLSNEVAPAKSMERRRRT